MSCHNYCVHINDETPLQNSYESSYETIDLSILPDIDIVASCSLGAAQRSIELAKDHVTNRKQFGQTLDNFQVIYELIVVLSSRTG